MGRKPPLSPPIALPTQTVHVAMTQAQLDAIEEHLGTRPRPSVVERPDRDLTEPPPPPDKRWRADSSHPWNVNRIVRTRTGWAPAGLSDSDVVVFPGPVIRLVGWFPPFAYGLAFLLLLWGCMAWEKWIGWVR